MDPAFCLLMVGCLLCKRRLRVIIPAVVNELSRGERIWGDVSAVADGYFVLNRALFLSPSMFVSFLLCGEERDSGSLCSR